MIIQDMKMLQWCKKAMKILNGKEYANNYYHVLTCDDPAPLIVHGETAQITVVIEGDGFLELYGEVSEIHQGTVVFIDATITHRFWCDHGSICLFHLHVPFESMFTDRTIIDGTDFEVHQ